jgi:hypothetical protein
MEEAEGPLTPRSCALPQPIRSSHRTRQDLNLDGTQAAQLQLPVALPLAPVHGMHFYKYCNRIHIMKSSILPYPFATNP